MKQQGKEKFYSIPFLAEFATNVPYRKISVEESVRQNLRMMLMSLPGQFRYDPTFGSTLNVQHFKLPDGSRGGKGFEDHLKTLIKDNLKMMVLRHEPRMILEDIIVNVHTPDPGKENKLIVSGRVALEIKLVGRIQGQQTFLHSELVPLL
jgi:phage baseplate assembly protein W